ncbi:DUF6266 family protein [Marinifilum flexuosum]|uniref:Uncharacterized protein n=1 Tax=Marinifilum flexuosum TaxID=1117708 RepID=A0A419X8S9_9BACT|nr:DUF6266 family protein [Marinifilum flexuosum]RKE04112.1 hypothetical protein BXY64_1126 [Marinifilum flexuosum]
MVKVKKGLLISGGGSIGNLVFYTRNGNTYARTKPSQYRDKKSQAQLAQRKKFDVVLRFLKKFKVLLRIGFAGEAIGRSAFQAAQSYHLKHAVKGEYPDIEFDYSKSKLCSGNVKFPEQVSISKAEDHILIEWEMPEVKNMNDTLIVAASTSIRCDYQITGVRRSMMKFKWFTNLSDYTGLHVWVAFRNEKESDVSDSLYFYLER